MGADLAERTDADLCAEALGGDRVALDLLYGRLKPRLRATAFALCGDASWAEDLVHEVFLALWEKRGHIGAPSSPAAYLAKSLRNAWINQREKRGRHVPVRRPSAVSGPGERERADLVREAVAALPDDQREALTLHRYGGLSYREVAEALGIAEKTVEGRMTRAFEELRRRLKPLLEDQ